eukprot:262308-Pelagomonas_calceolata.AAC.4
MRPHSPLQQCSKTHAPTSAISIKEKTILHKCPGHSMHALTRRASNTAPHYRRIEHRRYILQPLTATQSKEEFRYLQLDLPPPVNSRVTKSAFTKSSSAVKDCPAGHVPEFAVIGRSNVGKSSLINCLTGNDKLAKVSKTPGLPRLPVKTHAQSGWPSPRTTSSRGMHWHTCYCYWMAACPLSRWGNDSFLLGDRKQF